MSGFSRAEAGEIEQDFYEDDSGFEDLVADEDSAPTEANVDEIQRSSNDSSEMSHLEFRLALNKLLVGDITGRRKIGRPQSKLLASAVQLEHLYFKISKTKRQCVNFRERAKRLKKGNTPDEAQRPRESSYGCKKCDVYILCKGDCFDEWHHKEP